jgi:MerR family transcriptional regulator, light-induced transcriptional regulator
VRGGTRVRIWGMRRSGRGAGRGLGWIHSVPIRLRGRRRWWPLQSGVSIGRGESLCQEILTSSPEDIIEGGELEDGRADVRKGRGVSSPRNLLAPERTMEPQETREKTGTGGGNPRVSRDPAEQDVCSSRFRLEAPAGSRGPRLGQELDEAEIRRFVTVLRGFDETALDAYVSGALRKGISADRFLVELAAPAAREIGEEWADDRCDFVDVTLATGRLQRIVRSLGGQIPSEEPLAEGGRPVLLLASPSGQSHTLGMLMVAEFFQAASWSVCFGAPFELTPTPDLVASRFVHVVGLSLSLTDGVGQVKEEIRRIRRRSRNPGVGVIVGGPALFVQPDLVDAVGADAASVDARLAPEVARAFL